jgi:hypothetical protein
MSPVTAVAVSVATYAAVFILGAWWGARPHHRLVRKNRRLKRELRSSALQAAECYRLGYEQGFQVGYEAHMSDAYADRTYADPEMN